MNVEIRSNPARSDGFSPGYRLEQFVAEHGNAFSFAKLLKPNTNRSTPTLAAQNESTLLLEIDSFLVLAIHLAQAIQEIHEQQLVHGAIHPALIALKLTPIETAYSIQIHILDPKLVQQQQLKGQLAYLPPEQTGRINRPIDHRADLYAVGVIFYQLLTGRLPFLIQEPLELIHAHIATTPISPIQLYPHIPLPLAHIVLKLMAKEPQDRYQSATGLWLDLKHCLTAWRTSGQIARFDLGKGDISERLLLPEKLYGRQKELNLLVQAFEDVLAGDARLLLLTGDLGTGKTRLAREFVDSVVTRDGILLTYQAQLEQQNVPFAAAIGLLRHFVPQVLTREAEQITVWQERFAAASTNHTAQLIRHIPELGLLLNAPPDNHHETSEPVLLLNLALQNAFQAIAEVEPPLLIFVDDAQRADADSLQLLHNLTKNNPSPIMVIWAYRTDATMPHYLQTTIPKLPDEARLHLSPLDLAATRHFLAEALRTTIEQVHELAPLIQAKTNGNPFFLRQLMLALHEQGLLFFDFQQRAWRWNLTQIQATPLANNVMEMVQNRLQLLPEPVQKILKVAAMLGNRFEAERLATLCQQTSAAIVEHLQHALSLNVVVQLSAPSTSLLLGNQPVEPRATAMQQMALNLIPSPGKIHTQQQDQTVLPGEITAIAAVPSHIYQFAHEQVQIAAQRLLPTFSEESIHGQIGWRLWQNMTPAQRQENCFLLVRHLNQASALGVDWPDRVEVAQINLQASREALAMAAYENALSLALSGIQWLHDVDGWQKAYNLTRDLYLTAAQAASRFGQFQQTDRLLNILEEQATSVLDRVSATQERMLALYLQGKHEAAIAAALSALRLCGVSLPPRPDRRHIVLALLRTQIALLRNPIDRLATLPPLTNPHRLKAMEMMAAATISAAAANPNLLMLIGLEIIRQTLKYGSHPLSAMGYALYGVLLCGVTGQIERGYAFGQLALRLVPQIRGREHRVFIKYFVYAHVNHWKDHIQATLQPVRAISTTGEFEYLAVAAGLYPYFTWFISGMDLTTNEKTIAENMHLLEPFRDTPIYYRYQMGQQYYRNLLGWSDDPSQMVGAAYDERHLLPIHLSENDHTTIFYLACHKLTLCYLFGAYEQALDMVQLAMTHSQGGIGTPLIPVLFFYDSLARLALIPSNAGKTAQKHLKTVAVKQQKMRRWARHSPANCLHRYNLVAAEQARVLGEYGQARELYDRAIRQAQTHNYLPELAVAHEAAAKFYLSIEQPAYAKHHLHQAYLHYQTWGALGKLKQMESRFPQQLPVSSTDELGRLVGLSAYIDRTSALKAAQALSRITELPQLVDTLTTILIENAHAQHGCLLLPEGNEWRVVSRGGEEQPDGTQSEPVGAALTLVRQVARTCEPILLNDVVAHRSQDLYVQRVRPRSILCLPLLDKGELVGVFYMENRLTRHAFAPERLPLLTMLTSQAAIALKNTSLVTGLQEAQAKIQHSEQRFRLLFENAPLGILEIDIATAPPKICTVNRRAEALYGWSALEFVTLDPIQLIPKANRQEMQHLVETVRTGKTATLESQNQRCDGTIFPVRIIATPAPQQSGLHMIVAVEDITAQQQHRSEVAAIEEDRRRIAQEIHDGVAQNLAFLRFKLALWHDWVVSDPVRTQAELQQTQTLLDDTLVEIRRSIYALRPLALDTMGLLPVLHRYVADFNEQHNVYVRLQIDILEEQLSPEHELLFFRVIQEALNNIAQHAKASLAWVKLEMSGDHTTTLTIRDNGQGFDMANLNLSGRSGHLGLLQMRERTEQAGGHFVVTSRPGEGTLITLRFL